MTLPHDPALRQLQFYVTSPYPCGYLDDRQARSLIAVPQHLVNTDIYSELIRLGFRRSGKYTYRPSCENCIACVPVRVPVENFLPNRSQRRAWARHSDLSVHVIELQYSDEHFALYHAYQRTRHPSGGMDQDGVEQYRGFLTKSNVDTVMVEFREGGRLRMVSVVDCVQDGLSAVYTFYDCSDPKAAFGTYNVLWLIEWCQRLHLPYLYLGYWIAESRKMAYKKNFSPIEGLIDGTWRQI